ncbi:MAG: HAD family hydrolase [Pseudomonadota bacterium]
MSDTAWHSGDMEDIPVRVLEELEACDIRPGRPLIAVDADEVLVHFAEDFAAYCTARGNTFSLTEYSLDTALRGPDGKPLTRDQIMPLIHGFIDAETHRQRMIEGAAAALERLTDIAQIVVLTNAPHKVRDQRVQNLAGHGMPFPVVMNEGGKGRPLAWMAERAQAPLAFVDDSPAQHGSAAKYAPGVARLQLIGSTMLKPIIGKSDAAQAHPDGWIEAEAAIRSVLA